MVAKFILEFLYITYAILVLKEKEFNLSFCWLLGFLVSNNRYRHQLKQCGIPVIMMQEYLVELKSRCNFSSENLPGNGN